MRFIANKNYRILKSAALLTAIALVSFCFGSFMSGLRGLPDAYYAEDGAALAERLDRDRLPEYLTVKTAFAEDQRLSEVIGIVEHRLFGLIPVKRVNAYIGERVFLMPSGLPVGISIFTEGVLVVGVGSFNNREGKTVAPASDAGVKAGDLILSANGVDIEDSKELQSVIDNCAGQVRLSVKRHDEIMDIEVVPQQLEEGTGLRIGAWIRDSTVGIGTLAFVEPTTGALAALGHAVTDADTGTLLTVRRGRLTLAEVIGVIPGRQGAPGELHGTFGIESRVVGSVKSNTELGVFGAAEADAAELFACEPLPVAFPDEVHTGEAFILSSPDGGEVKRYACRIIKTGSQSRPAQKGLVIEMTDESLIELTGGIVQGMSGSPIIQDGRLVGVVTHVFVNEPKKGYGAYAYWVYRACKAA